MKSISLPKTSSFVYDLVDTSTGEVLIHESKKVSKVDYDTLKPFFDLFIESLKSCQYKELTIKLVPFVDSLSFQFSEDVF